MKEKTLNSKSWLKDDRNYPYRQIRQLLREHQRNIETDDDLELEWKHDEECLFLFFNVNSLRIKVWMLGE
jgi:hypothetical protein